MLESHSAGRHRYVALDSLRGLCACMVVLLHVSTQGNISTSLLVKHAALFVDFFFVLSGFVIGASYGVRLMGGFSIPRFMGRRLARIYPLHLALLLIFVAFETGLTVFGAGAGHRAPFEGNYSLDYLLHSLLLVQVFPGANPLAWNLPSWSIAAEVWIYLLFAVLLRFAGRRIAAICLLVAVSAPLWLISQPGFAPVMFENALIRCAMGFALGMLGWRCADRVLAMPLPRWMDHGLEIAVVAAVVAFIWILGGEKLSVLAPFLFLLAVLVFAREKGLLSVALKAGPLLMLGTLSYSIYLIHMFLYYRLLNLLSVVGPYVGRELVVGGGHGKIIGGGPLVGDCISILFLALVICCAYVSWRLIELPGQKLARELGSGRFAATVARILKSAFKRPM